MKKFLFSSLTCLSILLCSSFLVSNQESIIVSYELNPKDSKLSFYLKDKAGKHYCSLEALKSSLAKEGKELIFAMNGGMYTKEQNPLGLYIENGKVIRSINRVKNAYGNFYMQPNGIFYLTDNNEAFICTTSAFKLNNNIQFATQSGPMLVTDGALNVKFGVNSKNKYIRNGVGLLPNGNLLFAISKETINFYDFANFFKSKGCKNALYLDGFVSRAYIPSESWIQTDGNFGVIVAESK